MATFSALLDAEGFFLDPSVMTLRSMIRYASEFRRDNSHSLTGYRSIDQVPSGTVPVGSVEFVETILNRDHGISKVTPLQLPHPLQSPKLAVRRVYLAHGGEKVPDGDWFLKKVDRYKESSPTRFRSGVLPEGKWFISDYVEMEAEWRVFVINGRILDVRPYSGEYITQFNPERIKTFVDALSKHSPSNGVPAAFTLDIGVGLYKGRRYTMPIEVHHFYGCGLYGFEHPALPAMYSSTYYHLVRYGKR